MQDIEELKRQGLGIKAISKLTGWDRKTIRKYLAQPEAAPVYGPRAPRQSRLDTFKPYIEDRLKAGVWNARVLLRELRERGYGGGYTILTDWLRPQARIGTSHGRAPIRNTDWPSSAGGLGTPGHDRHER